VLKIFTSDELSRKHHEDGTRIKTRELVELTIIGMPRAIKTTR
jgi:hypothetical protein